MLNDQPFSWSMAIMLRDVVVNIVIHHAHVQYHKP